MRSKTLLALALLSVLPRITAAESFPKPSPEKMFADAKVYDAQGHPWRTAVEDWAGAKTRVATDPAWAAWLKAERASVDAWIAKHHDRVEWVAGWSHDGVSPKSASRPMNFAAISAMASAMNAAARRDSRGPLVP